MAGKDIKTETGRIQRTKHDKDVKNPSLEYKTDTKYDDRFGATYDAGTISPEQSEIMRRATADKFGTGRNPPQTKLPSDPIDDEIEGPRDKYNPSPRDDSDSGFGER